MHKKKEKPTIPMNKNLFIDRLKKKKFLLKINNNIFTSIPHTNF